MQPSEKALVPFVSVEHMMQLVHHVGLDAMLIGIGFVASFISGVFVVKGLLDFVSKHGFAPFAWWRIFVGIAGFAGLYFLG